MTRIALIGAGAIGSCITHALLNAQANQINHQPDWTIEDDSWLKDCFKQMAPHMNVIQAKMRERRKRLDEMMKYWTYEEETEKQATKRIVNSLIRKK